MKTQKISEPSVARGSNDWVNEVRQLTPIEASMNCTAKSLGIEELGWK